MKKTTHLLAIIVVLLFTSCESFFERTAKVDLPEHEPRLALSAAWHAGDAPFSSPFSIFLSRSVGALDEAAPPAVSNASVRLFEDDQLLATLTESSQDPGRYLAQDTLTLRPGHTYHLEAEGNGLPKITTEPETLPAKIDFDAAPFSTNDNRIKISFPNPPGTDYFVCFVNRIRQGTQSNNRIYLKPSSNQEHAYIQETGLIFDDSYFDNQPISLSLLLQQNSEPIPANDTLAIYLAHVTEGYYKLDRSLERSYYSDDFLGEPAFLYDNVRNGYGAFVLANVMVKKIVVGP